MAIEKVREGGAGLVQFLAGQRAFVVRRRVARQTERLIARP